jgi:4-carboxymuconolactone decarboxylase
LAGEFSEEQLLELLALAGYYHAISFIANAARIELEEGTPRFPAGATAVTTAA